MSSHFLVHSVPISWLIHQRYLIMVFLLFVFLCPCCSSRPESGPDGDTFENFTSESPELQAQREVIHRLTDQILLSLATHDFQQLEQYLASEPRALSGREAARILLGPQFHSVLLDHWNARQVKTSFSRDLLWATAQLNVSYRRSPNRAPQTALFTFRFHRLNPQADWRLYLR